MADRYWVGDATGIWDASETGNWSTTSGGLGGASVPTSADDVYFDANARTDVAVGSAVYCRNFTVTSGFPFSLTTYDNTTRAVYMAVYIYGNVDINKSACIQATYLIFYFYGSGADRTVKSSNNNFRYAYVYGSGKLTLRDPIVTSLTLYIASGGVLDTAGYAVSAGSLYLSSGTSALYLQNSVVSLTSSGTALYASAGTIYPGTSKIIFAGTSVTISLGATGGLYALEFTGNTTFVTFNQATSIPPQTVSIHSIKHSTFKTTATRYTFYAGATYVINNWQINGASGKLTSLRSGTAGSRYALSSTAQVDGAYLDIQDSAATDVPWYAANSTDSGNNTGWNFTTPATATSALFFGSNF